MKSKRVEVTSKVGKDAYKEPKVSYVTCRCKTKTLIATFFIITAILFAVASLPLSILLWLGVDDVSTDECSCPNASAMFNAELLALEKNNSDLMRELERLQNLTTTELSITDSILDIQMDLQDLSGELTDLQHRNEEFTSRTRTYTANLTNIFICTTEMEESCDIPRIDIDFSRQFPCFTFITNVDIQGTFLLSAQCALIGSPIMLHLEPTSSGMM